MKFTEEQFKQLIEIQKDQYLEDLYFEPTSSSEVLEHVVKKINPELHNFIDKNNLGNQAVALMNPLTREWAHERYVEKEKRYVWTSKEPNFFNGEYKRLYMSSEEFIDWFFVEEDERKGTDNQALNEQLTETEVREEGYDPERFDKEEVA